MIKGYRELSVEDVALINEIKSQGEILGLLVMRVRDRINVQQMPDGEPVRVAESEAMRWQSIAKTQLQQGLMALTRAVAQPGFF